MTEIGRLERVPLRTVWTHEAYDFTTWLENNVDVVNEVTGLNLIVIEREQAAGAFSIDLVAEDEDGGKVIIENQLEKSNHDHLGKVITYLSVLNARAAVWIVSEPRPEHVAAMSWLNDSSSGAFYLLKVEAVRIGSSPPAPLLTTIVRPSEDKSGIAVANQSFADRHSLRATWWKGLLARPDAQRHKHLTPGNSSYLGTKWGLPGLSLTYSLTQNQTGIELYIGREDPTENQAIFDRLLTDRMSIEGALEQPLDWDRMEGKRGCRIRLALPGGYREPDAAWGEIQAQQVAAMNRLEQALRPHLPTLRQLLGSSEEAE